MIQKIKNILKDQRMLEFLRYAIVGGISAVVDMLVNYLMLYVIFGATSDNTLMVVISVTAGFIVGLVLNFILSNVFVFKTHEQQKKGKTAGAFIVFAIIGVIGLGLTQVLTVAGTFFIGEEGIFYLMLTCFVKAVVLVWNYIGRKIFVYKEKVVGDGNSPESK